MARSAALLSLLAATLLLAACGKKHVADAEASTASAEQSADAPAAPEKKVDYWPYVAPLVAGSYGGECMSMPAMQKVDGAAIKLGTDGKASAPGFDGDVGHGKQTTIARELRDGVYRATANLSTTDESLLVALIGEADQAQASATIMAGDKQLMCGKVPELLSRLRSQPIYPGLAKVLEGPQVTLKCIDMKDMLKSHPTPLKIADGIVTLGKDTYDLRKAQLEMVLLMDGANSLSYAFTMPNGQMIQLIYGADGKVRDLQGRGKDEATHACGI